MTRRRASTSSRRHACPGAGACGGQFTANTMATVVRVPRHRRRWAAASVPATDPAKADVGASARARWSMDVLRRGVRPRADHHARRARERDRRRSPRPAARPTRCCTCWRSRARPASPLDIDDFDRISARVPLLADLKPGGRFVATDLHAPAASRWSRSGWSRPALLHGDAIDRHRPDASARRRATAVETAGQEVVRPLDNPLKPTGGLVILQGQPRARRRGGEGGRPRPSAASRPGARVRQRGSGVRRGAAPGASSPATSSYPLRRPERRARACARCSRVTGAHRRRRPRRLGGAGDRRPLLRRDARADGRPRRARSRRAAARSPPCARATSIVFDVAEPRRSTSSCQRRRASRQRLAAWTPPPPRYTTRRDGEVRAAGVVGVDGSGDGVDATIADCDRGSTNDRQSRSCASRCIDANRAFSDESDYETDRRADPVGMPGARRA